MSAERFQRIEQMYHEALERRGEERDAFLRQACAGDESLLREVQSLLQQSGEGVLDRPVWSSVGTRYDSSQVMIGRRIAHFEITGRLGEGGMGAVYKARDQHLDRDVALKVLLPEAVANPDRRRRFVREAKAASGLAHPNIVHIYDINEADGELFIAMEYVAGKTLDQAIDRKGLPLRDVLRYAVPMADALAKAHAAGIVHRDLKPSNVMITADRVVKVLDFGLAKLVERESDPSESAETVAMQESLQTKEGTVVGTAAYMSPEQAEGRPVDGRSDIFSFGAMLYEMLTGNRAFAGATRMATISSVLRDEPRPVTEVRESVPKELERIITRCLRKDPDRRFQHMEDLRVALEEVKEESESSAIAPPPTPPAGGRKWIWPAAAAALLVIGGLAAWRFAAPKPGSGESAETTPVTTVPGLAIGASFSPDGKQIVYSSNRNGWFEIYTRPSAGTGPERQITTDGKQATEPAWSPDGKSIAYHSVALHGIWVIPVTGGEARKVSDFGSSPAWSPDGRQLAFRSYEPSSLAPSDWPGDGESTIWRVDADGSNLQQLTLPRSPLGQHADPTWSPDGKRIAFASLNIITMGFRGALFTVDAATSEIKPLSVGEIWGAANPVFSPDGKGVYFAGRPKFAASNGVYYSEFSDPPKAVELCRTKQASPARIAVSRDGKALMFTRLVNNSQIWITETGKEPKPLYQDLVVRARLPNFSPDGTRLTYQVQSDDATLGIWLMNADGSNPMRIAQDLGNANGASWDETGTRLTINHFGTGAKPGVVLIGLADGSRKTLLEGSFDMLRNHMTPDGKDFIYDFGTPRNIWKRPVAGGPPKQLTFSRRRAWFPEVSWDSNWIVYQVSEGDDSQIAVMNRDGSQQKILTSGPGKRFSHSFASDNRRIAFAGYVNGVWNLYWIDRVTAETKQITHSTAYGSFVRSPAWRPNTDQMAYEFSEVKGNIERLPLSR